MSFDFAGSWKCEIGELTAVATICADHDVFVLADEIPADLALPSNRFTPFATAATKSGVRWAADAWTDQDLWSGSPRTQALRSAPATGSAAKAPALPE